MEKQSKADENDTKNLDKKLEDETHRGKRTIKRSKQYVDESSDDDSKKIIKQKVTFHIKQREKVPFFEIQEKKLRKA